MSTCSAPTSTRPSPGGATGSAPRSPSTAISAARDDGRGAVHHIGIRTDNLAALEARLRTAGVSFRSGIRDFGAWKYIMCPAPDGVLLELFEADTAILPADAARYFADETDQA